MSAAVEGRSDASPRSNRIVRHRVRKGDTLQAVAMIYGVSVEELRSWNRLSRKSALRLGQILRIAGPEKTAARQ
jgi:LysM repeat protein